MSTNDSPLIEARGLEKYFPQNAGLIAQLLGSETKHLKAVDGVDLEIRTGETVGIIGESGCGKSTLGEVLIGLQDATDGNVTYQGQNLQDMTEQEMLEFRRECQVIFQDPFESIDPRYDVESWVREPLTIHGLDNKDERIHNALLRAGLTPPEAFLDQHPHQLSGGERQRVSIARALVLEPRFIVADEPVSMLDVSIRASILNLMKSLVEELDMAVLYISHDLSLIRQMCDRTNVMYLGKFVEQGSTEKLIKDPKHPYTRALVDSVPIPDPTRTMGSAPVEGEAPDPVDLPEGCNFQPRCPHATDECAEEPTLAAYQEPSIDRRAACWHVEDIESTVAREAPVEPEDAGQR
ncbi:MAG: ABC transporter ATP-binding protein [Haloglomus sp.]